MATFRSGKRASTHLIAFPRSSAFLSVAAFTTFWVLCGGGVTENFVVFAGFAVTGSWMLFIACQPDGVSAWKALPWVAKLAITFFCLMPLLQSIPLPPAAWHGLPGRQLSIETLGMVGAAGDWHPITMTFPATFQTFLMSIWLAALLLAVLQLSSDEIRAVFKLLLALGLLHLLLGIVQVASEGRFLLYDVPNVNFLLGLFSNKNHSGLFIATLFPIGFVALSGDRGWHRGRLSFALAAAVVLFAALILTFSRAGLFFGLFAFTSLLLLANEQRFERAGRRAAIAALIALALLAVFASTDVATQALGRFGGIGSDPRWLFWSWSAQLIPAYFPVGSGIGSFPEVFKTMEQLSWVKPTYLNHAHSDYLEQLIEVGVAAPILWALVLSMLAGPFGRAWRERHRSAGKAALMGALIVVLTLIHSSFDYPLRRPALAAVFVVALAVLLRRGGAQKKIA